MKASIIFILGVLMIGSTLKADFLSEQKTYPRVRTAISEKGEIVKGKLNEAGIKLEDMEIAITAFKAEYLLRVYGKNKADSVFKKVCDYNIEEYSGDLGPKREEDDNQVPEGFYNIEKYNPDSGFYISFKINYPNNSDTILGRQGRLGYDIFIHGGSASAGCLAMTDERIKEIYLYAIYAKNNGQENIPVYIFPFEMTDENVVKYKNDPEHKDNAVLLKFWDNLKVGYDKFIKDKKVLKIKVDSEGKYIFK